MRHRHHAKASSKTPIGATERGNALHLCMTGRMEVPLLWLIIVGSCSIEVGSQGAESCWREDRFCVVLACSGGLRLVYARSSVLCAVYCAATDCRGYRYHGDMVCHVHETLTLDCAEEVSFSGVC